MKIAAPSGDSLAIDCEINRAVERAAESQTCIRFGHLLDRIGRKCANAVLINEVLDKVVERANAKGIRVEIDPIA